NHFNLIKPFYSFDYNNVHFVAMATAKNKLIPYNETSEQYQFIKNDLIQTSKNKNIDWIIVYSFRSFYSSNTTHPGLDELQDTYHSLFDKYNVDLVLQGHNHNYQRTYPLSYNVTKQYTPIITDKNTEYYNNIEKGQIFFTVGTGGANFYNFTGQAPYVVKQLLRHGFLNVDVDDSGSKLLVKFYDNTGVTRDQVIISKQKFNN
ncbi:MAG: metallophosphoesterase, partial [Nitrososphaeraceae archaeon]